MFLPGSALRSDSNKVWGKYSLSDMMADNSHFVIRIKVSFFLSQFFSLLFSLSYFNLANIMMCHAISYSVRS